MDLMLNKSANSNKQMVELKKSSHHIDLSSTSIIFWNLQISYEAHFNKFVSKENLTLISFFVFK